MHPHTEKRRIQNASRPAETLKFRSSNAVLFWQHKLDGEALPPFASAARKSAPTRGFAHPLQKPMRASALFLFWTIGKAHIKDILLSTHYKHIINISGIFKQLPHCRGRDILS